MNSQVLSQTLRRLAARAHLCDGSPHLSGDSTSQVLIALSGDLIGSWLVQSRLINETITHTRLKVKRFACTVSVPSAASKKPSFFSGRIEAARIGSGLLPARTRQCFSSSNADEDRSFYRYIAIAFRTASWEHLFSCTKASKVKTSSNSVCVCRFFISVSYGRNPSGSELYAITKCACDLSFLRTPF